VTNLILNLNLTVMLTASFHQSAAEFKTKDEFNTEVVRHVETSLARSLFNCDEA
jgi:hypothetical protein